MSLIIASIITIVILFRKGTHKIGWCLGLFWTAWYGYIDYCAYMDGRWLLTGIFMIFAAINVVNVIADEVKKHEVLVLPMSDEVHETEQAEFSVIDWKEH
jgi:hypothetical protein